MCIAKTKALISFAVTAKLICVFVFAYAKSRFSYDAAHTFLQPNSPGVDRCSRHFIIPEGHVYSLVAYLLPVEL